jgi:hypothetical protein
MPDTLLMLDGVELGRARVFEAGPSTLVTNDHLVPGGGWVLPGRDDPQPPTLDLELLTDADDAIGAREQIDRWVGAWRRTYKPAESSTLRYRIDGRWRRVYGRPDRHQGPGAGGADGVLHAGLGLLRAQFRLTDDLYYDDAEQSVNLEAVPPSTGGVVAPVVAPVRTTKRSDSSWRYIDVGGTAPTPLRITFYGPSSSPAVQIGSVRVALTGAVAWDRPVTVDGRTRLVTYSNGSSAAGLLTRTTRLAQLRVPPGRHEVRFSGSSEATVTVAWRDAWRTL